MDMDMVADVKCYHCGHISGQVEGTRRTRLVLHRFNPRPGYQGPKIGPGDKLRCERCQGPVFLEDLRRAPLEILPAVLPAREKSAKRTRGKAA